MANRKRTNPVQFYLDDDEQYILDEKFRLSGMKSKSAFLRKLILYGYVYDVDYSYLRNYNTELGRISSNLNQIAKRINSTGNIYQEDMDEVKELMNEVWRTQKSISLKGLNVDKLKAEYQKLMKQKSELTSTYKNCEKEVRELKRKQENLNQYLGRTQPDPAQEQQEKSKNQTL